MNGSSAPGAGVADPWRRCTEGVQKGEKHCIGTTNSQLFIACFMSPRLTSQMERSALLVRGVQLLAGTV